MHRKGTPPIGSGYTQEQWDRADSEDRNWAYQEAQDRQTAWERSSEGAEHRKKRWLQQWGEKERKKEAEKNRVEARRERIESALRDAPLLKRENAELKRRVAELEARLQPFLEEEREKKKSDIGSEIQRLERLYHVILSKSEAGIKTAFRDDGGKDNEVWKKEMHRHREITVPRLNRILGRIGKLRVSLNSI